MRNTEEIDNNNKSSIPEIKTSELSHKTPIGKGKFSTIYSATYKNDTYNMPVALKEKNKNDINNVLENELSFLSEVTDHSAIIRLYGVEYFEDSRTIKHLVLELMDTDLLTVLQKQLAGTGPNLLTSKSITQVSHKIAAGLERLHKKQLLHRDIKLDNILITNENGNLIVKLADFGLAEDCKKTDGWSTTFNGSPNYMAPELLKMALELLKKEKHSSAIDIYAFGVVIFELSTGRLDMEIAMGLTNSADFSSSIAAGARPHPSKLWNHELQKLLAQMLHQDPSKRPSASEIVTTLGNENAHFLFEHVDDDPQYKKYKMQSFLTTLIRNSISIILNSIEDYPPNAETSNLKTIKMLNSILVRCKNELKKTITFQQNSKTPKNLYEELTGALQYYFFKEKENLGWWHSQLQMALGYLLVPHALLRSKIFAGNMNNTDRQHVEKIISITSPEKWLHRYYRNKNLTESLTHSSRIVDITEVNNKKPLYSDDLAFDNIYTATLDNTAVIIKEEHLYAGKPTLTNEATLLQELQHCNNVIKLLGITIVNDTVFSIVLEKLDTDLWTLLEEVENSNAQPHLLNATTVYSLFMQIVTAINSMHALAIMHRDISPSNILIDLKSWTAKLSDFGFAKNYRSKGYAKRPYGTPYYMAPEILNGDGYTEAVDVYSFALVMLQTAGLDFECDEVNDDWDKDLTDMIHDGLELNPNDRPSMHEIFMTMNANPMLFKHLSPAQNNNNDATQENNDTVANKL